MRNNYLMTVNSTGNDEELIALTDCPSILVGENEDPAVPFPSVDWQFKVPLATNYVTKTAGTKQLFTKPGGFLARELVAKLKTVSGSASFAIVEQ